MVTMIMDGSDELNKLELDFFLNGNVSLDAVEARKPYVWISENGWKDMQRLEQLGDVWSGFLDALRGAPQPWQEWYDLEAPEQTEIPCGYSQKLSKF